MFSVFLSLALVDQIFGVVIDRGFLSWVFLGLVAGWLAGKIARGRGYGCLTDILLGLIGSVLGGWIFRKLEVGTGTGGWIYSLAAATVGAVVLVVIVHLFTGGDKD
ncbi:MAG: GlsB/YeaQ/YmgE family stress response membrane protein [Acidobacteria bacterium]|nr:GlsB/YeaQ/YmgE family stress response membrane protein [Acidobacteriota bacterium]MBS1865634.1 GlsB/YeaQ/YmgE family stress response membrane protein [Acidobacteriota bacterium]